MQGTGSIWEYVVRDSIVTYYRELESCQDIPTALIKAVRGTIQPVLLGDTFQCIHVNEARE